MKRIEGANEGQNDHMVWGVVVALHMSMLKSCLWLEGSSQLEDTQINMETSDPKTFEEQRC